MKKLLLIGLAAFTISAYVSTAKAQHRHSFLKERLNATLNERTTDLQKKMELVEYEILPKTDTISLIGALNTIFSNDAYIAVQDYTNNFDFTLHTIKEMKEMEKESEQKRFNFSGLKNHLYVILFEAIKNGTNLKIVKLKWLYNGKDTIHSTAIATDEHGIFFETIGHLLMDPHSSQFAANTLSVDNAPEEGTLNSTKRRFNHTFHCYNLFGQTVCSYTIDCFSEFNADGVLKNRGNRTSTKTVEGYTCSDSFGFTSGLIDESTFNEFKWKWTYTSGSTTPENRGFEEAGKGIHQAKDEKIDVISF